MKTIIIPLDGSVLAERAIPFARGMATRLTTRVILLRVVAPIRGEATDEAFDAEVHDLHQAEEYLHEIALRLPGELSVETLAVVGDPARVIVEEAERSAADFIAMSTHGRSGLGRLIHGSVADAVVRQTGRPVLLIPAHCAQVWPVTPHPRVLVPLDGSALAEAALGPAKSLARTLGASLTLVRVTDLQPFVYAAPPEAMLIDPTEQLEQAQADLKRVAVELRGEGFAVSTVERLGPATANVLDVAAECRADAIAMATHGNGGFSRAVLGSVTTGIVQRARVPLLITRPSPSRSVATAGAPAVTTAER